METVNIGGSWALADLGDSVQGYARGFKTVSVARSTKVRTAKKSLFAYPTEGQPPSFPCAKRQRSIISMLKRQSLPT
jgi:hypothetical protein